MPGTLHIVATPIGNLEDITLRALETLKHADLILCEDTRVTKNLLDHYEIKTPTMSYHQHSDAHRTKEIERMLLEEGKNIALVTDAGTPGISDPGNQLVSYLTKEGITITTSPGPSAVVAALSVAGFPTDRFTFLGFPPHKNKREKFFKKVAAIDHTIVFYESTHRIHKCIGELAAVLPADRQVMIARELTKKFETLYRGKIQDIALQEIKEKGEFVVVINAL